LFNEQAQQKADMGYVVIGAWKNKGGHPHYVTVRPNKKYGKEGPTVAHVGSTPNEERTAEKAFRVPLPDIHWYYNRNQEFTKGFKLTKKNDKEGHTVTDVTQI
jgi:hypothetical protein